MPPTVAPRRAAPMAADDRRQAIVDAVVPLLLEQGGDVTTRQIAEAAGIAEGTIFRVFPDKAALLRRGGRGGDQPRRPAAPSFDAIRTGSPTCASGCCVVAERLHGADAGGRWR